MIQEITQFISLQPGLRSQATTFIPGSALWCIIWFVLALPQPPHLQNQNDMSNLATKLLPALDELAAEVTQATPAPQVLWISHCLSTSVLSNQIHDLINAI